MILVTQPSGVSNTTITTLEQARTSSIAAGATVVVTSALTAAQSNINGVWPDDRKLRIEFGGSIANTTDFAFFNGLRFEAGLDYVFKGTGLVKGLRTVYPEWWGANNSNDATSAVNAAWKCVISNGNPTAPSTPATPPTSTPPYVPTQPNVPAKPSFSTAQDHAETNGGTIILSQHYNVSRCNFATTSPDYSKTVVVRGVGRKASGFIGFDNDSAIIDLSGTNDTVMEDFGITGYGNVAILRARLQSSQTCHNHVTRNLYINGFFTYGCVAMLAAESCTDYDMDAQNRMATYWTPVLVASPYNDAGIPMHAGEFFPSSITDNRFFGGNFRNYTLNGVCARYKESAGITFFGTNFITGESAYAIHCLYELTGNHGGVFGGQLAYYDCLFEGGNFGGENPGNPISHLLTGIAGDTCSYHHINSYGGYYNYTSSPSGKTVMTYANPSILFDSSIVNTRFNPSADPSHPGPVVALTATERCTIDITSRNKNEVVSIAAYQGPDVELNAATVNYATNNHGQAPVTTGPAIPAAGKFGRGHIHLKGVDVYGSPTPPSPAPLNVGDVIGWTCWDASSATYPQGRWSPIKAA